MYSITTNGKLEPRSKYRLAPYIKQPAGGVRAVTESGYPKYWIKPFYIYDVKLEMSLRKERKLARW